MRNSLKGDKEKRTALVSRAGTVNSYLLEIDKDIYEWHTVSDNICYQVSYSKEDKDEIFMLDPEDGPAIMIGYSFGIQKVDRIRRVKDENGYAKYLVFFK